MGSPAAKQGDKIQATDNHLIQPPGTAPPFIAPHSFMGTIDGQLSSDVNIEGRPAAVVGSEATNTPPHIPSGGTFVNPPQNKGKIIQGSFSVMINGKPAARSGDIAKTCNDPVDLPVGTVQAQSTVNMG